VLTPGVVTFFLGLSHDEKLRYGQRLLGYQLCDVLSHFYFGLSGYGSIDNLVELAENIESDKGNVLRTYNLPKHLLELKLIFQT